MRRPLKYPRSRTHARATLPARARYALTLYVAGQTPRSALAIQSCTNLCKTHLHGRYALTIIDLYQHPALAKRDGIVAVPTLIRQRPRPVRTLIGTLTSPTKVLAGLDLGPASGTHTRKDTA
jgi:circadian clock protein KaiB